MGMLDGKVIVIAGAGGIGTGLAVRYAAEGAQVIVGDIDEDGARAAAAAAGPNARGIRMDGADEASVQAAVDLAVREHGGLDGMHANFTSDGEGAHGRDVLELELDTYDRVMRVNARGFLLCTRAALPPIIARGGGAILYTSSAASFVGMPVRVAYSMSKAAINALMRSVARRYGPDGVRANALSPGLCTHPRFEAAVPPEEVAKMSADIPLGRLATPADVAGMSAFLMSDGGSYVSGQFISVDGASTMRQ